MSNDANWQNAYTPEELERIKENWRGQPPAECKGHCKIWGFLAIGCAVCGWGEDLPANGSEDYKP